MTTLLVLTFLITYLIISESKGSKNYFFNLPFLVSTPPLVGLIYFGIISKFNFIGEDGGKFISPIFDEISAIYIKTLLCFSFFIFLIRIFTKPFVIARYQLLPSASLSLIILLIFSLTERFILAFNPSIHLLILFSELTNLSLVLFLSSIIINFRFNKSIYSFLLIAGSTIFIFFIITFDKGLTISIFASLFLILLGSKNFNIKITSLKTNLLILLGGILIPFLNFIEEFFFATLKGGFQSLTEVMESSVFHNYYHIFRSPDCNYQQSISIMESILSPFRAIFGMNLPIHQHDFMKTCFPIQRLQGAGRGFGLINESLLSNELPSYIYFSLCAIAFILILEYFYFRFSLVGLLVFSQSIELIYKLTRSDSISSLFALIYTIIASFIIYLTILFLNPNYVSNKE